LSAALNAFAARCRVHSALMEINMKVGIQMKTKIGAAAALIGGLVFGTQSIAAVPPTIPVVVTTCATCNNQATLDAAAMAYTLKWVQKTPPGYVGVVEYQLPGPTCASQAGATTILVVSTLAPLSGAFWPCLRCPHGICTWVMIPINATTDMDVIAADNAMFHRSAKLDPIKLPTNLPLVPWADADELYGSWLAGNLIMTSTSFSLFHQLTSLNIGAVQQGVFRIAGTTTTFTIWSTDTIQVKDTNGNTALFQWIPSASPFWIYKQGSLRDKNGKPLPDKTTAPVPNTGGTVQPIGPIEISYPGGPTLDLWPMYGDNTPDGSVTVGEPYAVSIVLGAGD
jgi:hypothetical protein